MNKKLSIILGVAVLGGTVLTVNALTNIALQNEIRASLLAGKIPVIDISKVSPEEFTQAYVDLAKSSGVDFDDAVKRKDFNLYRLIRDSESKKGNIVAPSEDPKAEQVNSTEEFK